MRSLGVVAGTAIGGWAGSWATCEVSERPRRPKGSCADGTSELGVASDIVNVDGADPRGDGGSVVGGCAEGELANRELPVSCEKALPSFAGETGGASPVDD